MTQKTQIPQSTSRISKILQFPLTRIVLATLFVGIGVIAAQLIITLIGKVLPSKNPFVSIVSALIALLAVYFAYRFYNSLIEQRPVSELSKEGAGRELSIGILLGTGLLATIIGILWVLGYYHITGMHSWFVLIPALVSNVPSAFIQEIIFRGIIFRITEESLGSWIALVISALLFGLIHILSANATVFSTIAIMLEAGVLLGAAFMLTHRLWLPIGIHTAWDFANDGIFGVGAAALSGTPVEGLLKANLTGPLLVSGGKAGIEGSMVAVVVILIVSAYLIQRSIRAGHIVQPIWMRN